MEKKICSWCKKEFEPHWKTQKYCCDDHRRKYLEKHRKKRQYLLKCDGCGKEFNSAHNKSKSHPLAFCCKQCSNNYRKIHNKKIECAYCGELFIPLDERQKYCSRECQEKNKLLNTERICLQCGKPYFSDTKTLFCSNECKNKHIMSLYEEKKCLECGELFKGPTWQKFCNSTHKQRYLSKLNMVEAICECCGETFLTSKYNNSQHKFCSHSCIMEWEYKNGIITAKKSSQHLKIDKILEQLNISFTDEVSYGKYSADIDLTGQNKIIEIMGTYWHGDCRKYDFDKLEERQIKCIEKDKRKRDFIKKDCGVTTLYLWQYDIENEEELCIKIIISFIKDELIDLHSSSYKLVNDELILYQGNEKITQYMEQ